MNFKISTKVCIENSDSLQFTDLHEIFFVKQIHKKVRDGILVRQNFPMLLDLTCEFHDAHMYWFAIIFKIIKFHYFGRRFPSCMEMLCYIV